MNTTNINELINTIENLADFINQLYPNSVNIQPNLKTKVGVEQHKRELLQRDRNLADDEAEVLEIINKNEAELIALKKRMQSINGTKGNLVKNLMKIREERAMIHREWIEKYSNR